MVLLVLAGTREDSPHDLNDSKEDSVENAVGGSESVSQEKLVYSYGANTRVASVQDYHKFSDYKLSSEGTYTASMLMRSFVMKILG